MNSLRLIDFFFISPLILLFLFSLIPIYLKTFHFKNKEFSLMSSVGISAMGLLASFALLMIFHGNLFQGFTKYAFSKTLIFDSFTYVSMVVIFILSLLSLPFFVNHPSIRQSQFSEYLFLYLSAVLGMLVLVASHDLIMTFIGLEMMSLCLYMMITMNRETHFSKEAAIKYFVLGSLASAILLYGISLIYGSSVILSSGQIITNYSSLSEISGDLISRDRLFLMGYTLILVGFGFKVAMFPFHMWVPDVYQGSSTPLTLFMATAVKAASFLAFTRFIMIEALEQSFILTSILQWLAVLTMFFGNFGALVQSSFKRVLAYSSVAHSGYILVGLLAVAFGEPAFGSQLRAGVIYILAYGLFTVGTFGFLSFLETDEGKDVQVEDIKGLFYSSPGMALGLSICLLGLAGIPPTLGFFSKFLIFSEALSQEFYWLVLWALINSVVGVYYYLRPIVLMFFYKEKTSVCLRYNVFQKMVFLITALLSLLGSFFLPMFL